MTSAVTPPRTRDRTATRERILAAVGEVLARDGFATLGVNAVAKQAGVDKVLIYRYFGGLPELLRAWGDSGRFWPRVQDLLGDEPQRILSLPAAQRWALFFDHFIEALRQRPLTLEILAAEVSERNELTAILETEREQWGEEVGRLLGGPEYVNEPWRPQITAMLIAAVQYLLVRGRTIRLFGPLELQSDEGWGEIRRSLHRLADVMLAPPAVEPSAAPPALKKAR